MNKTATATVLPSAPPDKEKKITSIPDWQEWGKRPTCTLWEGMYLAHNIVTNKPAYSRLLKQEDPRTKGFRTHRNTSYKALKAKVSPLNYIGKLPENIDDVVLFLPDFIEWAESQSWEHLPDEFIQLKLKHVPVSQPPNWSIWKDRPSLTLKEAVSLLIDIDPKIHFQPHARLIYKKNFEQYDATADTVLRVLRGTPDKYLLSNEINSDSFIRADIFEELLKNLEWDVPKKLQDLSLRASKLLPNKEIDALPEPSVPTQIPKQKNLISIEATEEKSAIILAALTLVFARSSVNKSDLEMSPKVRSKYFTEEGKCRFSTLANEVADVLTKQLNDPATNYKNGTSSIEKKIRAGLSKFKPEYVGEYIFQDYLGENISE